jgi:ComEC/Rec2-related protein
VREIPILKQRFPFAGLLMAAMAGILLSSWLGLGWPLLIALVLISLPLMIFLSSGGLCWVLSMGIFALLQLWNWQESPARKLAVWFDDHPGEFHVEGIVSGEPKVSSPGSVTFPMRLGSLVPIGTNESSEQAGKPVTVPVEVQVKWSGVIPRYGDMVGFQAIPSRPALPRNPGAMDYRRWLERHGIHTQFRIDPSEPGAILSSGHGNPLIAWAISSRQRMEAILAVDMGDSAEVLSAMKGITLGVTENSPEGFTDDFRFTGTMHLFSVSGLHVGMLAVIIWFVLKAARIPRGWAVALTIPVLFFYVAVTGLKSGSVRSATMASIMLVGLVLHRRSPMINTLAASAFLQLAIDTNILFSAGWQFSYTVVFAILVAAGPIERWVVSRHAPDPFIPPKLLTRRERLGFDSWKQLAGLAAVSAAAWIGSLVPTIAYFHLVSLSAFGANLLAVPLAFGVLSLGMLSLLGGSVSLWVAGAFNNANWLVTKLLLLVVQVSAMMPGGHWFVGPPGKPFPMMTILDLRGASCAVIRSGGDIAMIDAGRRRDAISTILPFLESSGANSVRSVLITKSDAAHLGGLAEIMREIPVKGTALPPGDGRSPVAKKFQADGRKVRRVQAGEDLALSPGVTASILAAAPGKDRDSLITMVTMGEVRILFLPRLAGGISELVMKLPDQELHADVLVLPLGGSEMSATLGVIHKVSPRTVISSVDALNRNGTPSGEWKGILREEGIMLLRQDETGAVILEADPKAPREAPVAVPFLGEPLNRVHRSDSKKAFD